MLTSSASRPASPTTALALSASRPRVEPCSRPSGAVAGSGRPRFARSASARPSGPLRPLGAAGPLGASRFARQKRAVLLPLALRASPSRVAPCWLRRTVARKSKSPRQPRRKKPVIKSNDKSCPAIVRMSDSADIRTMPIILELCRRQGSSPLSRRGCGLGLDAGHIKRQGSDSPSAALTRRPGREEDTPAPFPAPAHSGARVATATAKPHQMPAAVARSAGPSGFLL